MFSFSDFSFMFNQLNNLEQLQIKNFQTDEALNMRNMFAGNYKLTSLDVSSFITSKVTDMTMMFYNCINLESLDVTNFNTNEVKYMSLMFNNCSSLENLDLSSFNTSGCIDLVSIVDDIPDLTVTLKNSSDNENLIKEISETANITYI